MLSQKVGGEKSEACDGTAAGGEAAESGEEQARCPKVPVNPGRPTLKKRSKNITAYIGPFAAGALTVSEERQ